MSISSSNFLLFRVRILPLREISRDRLTSLAPSAHLCNGKQVLPRAVVRMRIKLQDTISDLSPVPAAQCHPELLVWGTDEGEIKVSGEMSVSHPLSGAGCRHCGGGGRQPPSLESAGGNRKSVGPGVLNAALYSSQVTPVSNPQFQRL